MNVGTFSEQDLRCAVGELTHGCDGPVTAFVILARATRQVANGRDEDLYAEAAYDALVSHGFMADHEAARMNAPAVNSAD